MKIERQDIRTEINILENIIMGSLSVYLDSSADLMI